MTQTGLNTRQFGPSNSLQCNPACARHSSSLRWQSGLNLFELMITLAIAGILMALALPSFNSIMGDSQMVSTTNDFVTSIHTARSEAVKRGEFAGVCPSENPLSATAVCKNGGSWGTGWITFVDNDQDGIRDTPGEELLVQMPARSPGFTFTSPAALKNLIYFDTDGGVVTAAGVPISGTINVKFGADEERNIAISANGRVSTETP